MQRNVQSNIEQLAIKVELPFAIHGKLNLHSVTKRCTNIFSHEFKMAFGGNESEEIQNGKNEELNYIKNEKFEALISSETSSASSC